MGAAAGSLGLVALLIWWLSGGTQPDLDAPPARTPGAARATSPPRTDPRDSAFIGVVVSPAEVRVSAAVSGKVLAVHVKVGERVEKGAPLATMDLREARQDLRMNRASLAAARAERTKAGLEEAQASERLARLLATQQYTSEEEVSAARYRHGLARAQVASAAAKVAEQAAVVERLRGAVVEGKLLAPFAGHVAQRFVDPGARVQAGEPIVRIIGEGVRIRFAVPEPALGGLKAGARVEVSLPEGGGAHAAVVETVWPEVDIASRRTFVEARVEADGRAELSAGTPVQVRVAAVAVE